MSLQRVTNRPGHWCRVRSACRLFAAGLVFIPLSFAFATLQETGRGGKDEPRKEAAKANRDELGTIKQEEALRNLQRLEARMQKLAARANEREPASGAKNRLIKNSTPTTTAVKPVRPPDTIPAVDSI